VQNNGRATARDSARFHAAHPHSVRDIAHGLLCKALSKRRIGWPHVCIGVDMDVTFSERVRSAIQARSHEIVDQALLEIWRRPSLSYTRRAAEWELRAWLLGILMRVGASDPSLGFVHFSGPFLWHEAVETIRILMRRTTLILIFS
jgi:hypothetical protein